MTEEEYVQLMRTATGGTTSSWLDKLKGFFTDDDKSPDWSRILGSGLGAYGIASLLAGGTGDVNRFLGLGGGSQQPVGYQGGIPKYTYNRVALPTADRNLQMNQVRDWATQYNQDPETKVANVQGLMDQGIGFDQILQHAALAGAPYTPKTAMPTRRPGSEGRRYFSDATYTPTGDVLRGVTPPGDVQLMAKGGLASLARSDNYAGGGLASLPQSRGYYLGGSTDGMADKIPARIDNKQEARLSDGEFVMPADIVSHLGNGNSDAGAKVLYDMMDRVRKARTGTPKQGRQIDPNKYTPA
jgi:hypothetical protein